VAWLESIEPDVFVLHPVNGRSLFQRPKASPPEENSLGAIFIGELDRGATVELENVMMTSNREHGIVPIASLARAARSAEFPTEPTTSARRVRRHFWPGPSGRTEPAERALRRRAKNFPP